MFAEPLARRIWAAGPSPDLRTTLGPQPVGVHHRGPWNRCVATYLDSLVRPENVCRELPLAATQHRDPRPKVGSAMMNTYYSQHYSPLATESSTSAGGAEDPPQPPQMTPDWCTQTADNPSQEKFSRRAVRGPARRVRRRVRRRSWSACSSAASPRRRSPRPRGATSDRCRPVPRATASGCTHPGRRAPRCPSR